MDIRSRDRIAEGGIVNSWLNSLSKKKTSNPAQWFLVDRNKVMPEPTQDGSLKVYISQYDVPDAFRAYVLPEKGNEDFFTAVIEFRYIDLGEKREKRSIDRQHDVEIGVNTKRAYRIFIKFPKSEAEHKVAFELVPDDINRVMDNLGDNVHAAKVQYSAAKKAVSTYKGNMEKLLFPA